MKTKRKRVGKKALSLAILWRGTSVDVEEGEGEERTVGVWQYYALVP